MPIHLYEVRYATWAGDNLPSHIDTRFIAASSQAAAVSCVRQRLYASDSTSEIEIREVVVRLPVDHIAYGSL